MPAHICHLIVSLVLSFSSFTHFAQPSELLYDTAAVWWNTASDASDSSESK